MATTTAARIAVTDALPAPDDRTGVVSPAPGGRLESSPSGSRTDVELVAAMVGGCVDSFDEVYRRHQPAMCTLARRLCDRMEAEDVAHDVLARFWAAPQAFDPARGALRAYLLTRTRGRTIDVLRSRTARSARETTAATEAPVAAFGDETDVLGHRTSTVMADLVAGLPASERSAILLAFFGGYSYRQVAERLGRPEGTVKSSIRSGLRRMHAAMADPVATSAPPRPAGAQKRSSAGAPSTVAVPSGWITAL